MAIAIRGTVNSRNPVEFAVIEYVPGGTPGNEYWPAALVTALRATPVDRSFNSTWVAGTSAPLGSVAVPIKVPVLADCPESEAAIGAKARRVKAIRRRSRLL